MTTTTSPASMGGPLSEAERIADEVDAIRVVVAADEKGQRAYWDLDDIQVLLAHIKGLEGQLATAHERLNTAEGRGITAEQVAAVINPGAWRELESHATDLFNDPDERARYEASFAEAIRQTRAPSLAAAERVLAFFRPEPARALGLDGGDPDGR